MARDERDRADGGVQGDDRVADEGEAEDAGGQGLAAAGAQRAAPQTEREHREAERNGERELAGERRLDVAAPDVERLVEQERHGGRGEDGRGGELLVAEPAGGPCGDGEQEEA